MKHFFLIIGVLVGTLFSSRSQTTTTLSMQHDGLTREYILYVPANYSASSPVPLLLNLHGYTSNNTQQMAYGDFRPIADTAGFIIAHPNGTFDGSGNRWWNAFGTTGVDDVGFLDALIDTISSNYSINADRVYSTGMSNGGFMSIALACELSPKITAIASVTGSMSSYHYNNCNAQMPVPVMQIHGTNDGTVGYNDNSTTASIPELVDYWVGHNNCDVTASITNVPDNDPNDGCTAEHYLYPNGDNGATVEHYKIIDGEHTWPGAPVDIGVTNHDFSASYEIWRFFSQFESQQFAHTDQLKEKQKIVIYPNPAESMLYIEGLLSNQKTHISVTDYAGKVVLETTLEENTLNVEHLSPGVYLVKVSTDNHHSMIKLIKK